MAVSKDEQIFSPGPEERTVRDSAGKVHTVPEGWVLLPPGDAALTRRAKAAGEYWLVQEKKGRKVFSRGIWTSPERIERIRADLEKERATESFAKRKESDAKRRAEVQAEYVEDFERSIREFLRFDNRYRVQADQLARLVSVHATPVGSGTVARTKRIPIEERAEAAVIAWMRHQTTAYDTMKIPREKGKRREVRRMLAKHSQGILDRYRKGEKIEPNCALWIALQVSAAQHGE